MISTFLYILWFGYIMAFILFTTRTARLDIYEQRVLNAIYFAAVDDCIDALDKDEVCLTVTKRREAYEKATGKRWRMILLFWKSPSSFYPADPWFISPIKSFQDSADSAKQKLTSRAKKEK